MAGKTPIYSALLKYMEENCVRLHMPGHAGGKGLAPPVFKQMGFFDVTEIPPFDNLHLPTGIIEESRQLLAKVYGAYQSFFLVNGATSGIQALFLGLAGEGEKVLVNRHMHTSFFGGMVLAGCKPVYIPYKVDGEWGLPLAVAAADVDKALMDNPGARFIFITSPTYYGTASDIKGIAELAGRYNIPLAVDEAHGGHFAFHPSYPPSSLASGADAVVNGLHKTLPVFNQGACLHISSSLKDKERIFRSYTLLTTTSPSYPILASIEMARAVMEEKGYELLDRALRWAEEYKKKINQIKGLRCGDEFLEAEGVTGHDPLKLVIFCDGLTIDGYKLDYLLRRDYRIQVEMSQPHLILAMMSIFHEREDWEKLYKSLAFIAEKYYNGKRKDKPRAINLIPQVALTPRQAFLAPKKQVKFKESKGFIAGEMVAAYPPGIPCLLPGEVISEEVYDYIMYLKTRGAYLVGIKDKDLNFIDIIET
ncbi:aminotransferase class I/II-fold pyridoxal phosphate-dependent enzyme [Thermosyntropha lipolytica]|uniref:aminotransferase class I/II-fold pyridoxal phosphate-dependent enzyme n=1 Tax=Thermosyntropha lipolytica TaxID=54294 RepID=UPI001356553D|nr:aminotransferase class I/II-fold pyridoxal phosphate-dependent enzyme [Thermosyntropha lipolytica]